MKKNLAIIVLAAFWLSALGVQAEITNGIVAWYRLNENSGTNANDYSPSGYNGTFQNSSPTSPPWAFDGGYPALGFNGTNYVQLPGGFAVPSSMTFSFWMKPAYWGANSTVVGARNNGTFIVEFNAAGTLDSYMGSAGNTHVGSLGMAALQTNLWYFITITCTGGAYSGYVNGSPSGSVGAAMSASTSLAIGADVGGGPNRRFNGLLRDMRFYNRVLTGGEVGQLYANGPYAGPIISKPTLFVTNGTGFGYYTNGQVVSVSANRIYGNTFTGWIGDTGFLNDPSAADTYVTMPATNICVSASYVTNYIPGTNVLDVTEFGAKGDAIKTTANTVGNSTMITIPSASLTGADVGKLVELFGVGDPTSGYPGGIFAAGHQDLIATIVSVSNGTNAILDLSPSVASNGVYCIYGTQNVQPFQAAVDLAAGTNTDIIIPAGNYLMIAPIQLGNYVWNPPVSIPQDQAIIIRKGGLHFIGAGRGSTSLIGDGAWKNQGGVCARAGIFSCIGPITNDYPLVLEGFTMDGGLPAGRTSDAGYFPVGPGGNWVTGSGWDGSSYAAVDMGSEPLNTIKIFKDCGFTTFRGEMVKSITSSGGGASRIIITNCIFTDGNATAFNYTFPHTITGCTFSNMYQVTEFYQAYATNASYFENNFMTEMYGNCIYAFNGATGTNAPYYVRNNIFNVFANNAIGTMPGCNISIISNKFNCLNPAIICAIGAAGYQGAYCNSNIVIGYNTVSNAGVFLALEGQYANNNHAVNVQVFSNNVFQSGGWTSAVETVL